jgi:hypothetical protein
VAGRVWEELGVEYYSVVVVLVTRKWEKLSSGLSVVELRSQRTFLDEKERRKPKVPIHPEDCYGLGLQKGPLVIPTVMDGNINDFLTNPHLSLLLGSSM